jgi:glycosyltransferase involved in cell wall biosynthesis
VLADIATFRELWDDAALFAPVGDDDAFVDAIERLLADPAQAQRLGDAAIARARRYTPAATAKAMAGLYAQLTESRAAA